VTRAQRAEHGAPGLAELLADLGGAREQKLARTDTAAPPVAGAGQ
jgi:hypothetical protein